MAGQRCGKGLKDVFVCIRVIAGSRQHPSSSFQRPVHFLQLSSETGFFSANVLIPAEKCRLWRNACGHTANLQSTEHGVVAATPAAQGSSTRCRVAVPRDAALVPSGHHLRRDSGYSRVCPRTPRSLPSARGSTAPGCVQERFWQCLVSLAQVFGLKIHLDLRHFQPNFCLL